MSVWHFDGEGHGLLSFKCQRRVCYQCQVSKQILENPGQSQGQSQLSLHGGRCNKVRKQCSHCHELIGCVIFNPTPWDRKPREARTKSAIGQGFRLMIRFVWIWSEERRTACMFIRYSTISTCKLPYLDSRALKFTSSFLSTSSVRNPIV